MISLFDFDKEIFIEKNSIPIIDTISLKVLRVLQILQVLRVENIKAFPVRG